MTTFLAFLTLLIALLVGFLIGWLLPKKQASQTDTEPILQHIDSLGQWLGQHLQNSSTRVQQTIHYQHEESSKLIKEITQEIASVKEIGRQTKVYAEQVQSLQSILHSPKQRGILGEYFLEMVLQNTMSPEDYKIQYEFKNGEVVDTVIILDKKLVPVDSKFSLENYNKAMSSLPNSPEKASFEKAFINDLKLRIQETSKYIRPQEGTVDFAFMFIPSEGIYYDLLTNKIGEENLIHRAASKYKVIIVSPTSFLAYLQTVMQGLRALTIEKHADEIKKRVGDLVTHISKQEEYHQKLGSSLATAVSHFNNSHKELGKIDKDIFRMTGTKAGVDLMTVDKPLLE